MTQRDETFYYATELDGQAPTFADTHAFRYDRYLNGEPTAYKLARVAAPIEYERCLFRPGVDWRSDRRRFFFWGANGELYIGSIEVEVEYEPRFVPLAKTVRRAAA